MAASNDIQTMMITTKSSTIITDRLCERVKEHHEKFQLRYTTLNRFYILFLPPGTSVRMVEGEIHIGMKIILKSEISFGNSVESKILSENYNLNFIPRKEFKIQISVFLFFSVLLSLSLDCRPLKIMAIVILIMKICIRQMLNCITMKMTRAIRSHMK